MKKQFIETGRIVGTHGIRGEMRAEVWSDTPEMLKKLPHLYFDGGETEVRLLSRRVHKNMLLLTVEGVDSIEEAEKLRGRRLYLNRDDVQLEEGRRFIADLVGLTAVDGETGAVYGTLTEVFRTGANDVYRIVDENGGEYLFPAVPHMIKGVDDDGGVIELLPIPGIFDDGGSAMRIDIITLFPEMFSVLDESILARARKKGALQICCHQLRDFSRFAHNRVDDMVFGGGKGMLLMAEPIAACIDAIHEHLGVLPPVVYMSPRGKVLTQERAKGLAKLSNLIILCGHYEGVDQRVLDAYHAEEISIGDYVLTGGEVPAMVLADVVCRMLDGVLAGEECFTEESHYNGLLEYPQFTRPEQWRDRTVPPVLLSGHHENIRRFKRGQSLRLTRKRRPELLDGIALSKEDKRLLEKDE